eukprot:gb/GECG01016141.1/.p1 GENE.gb/GECG01016141.1/~~gb/GECG01016141.1/.p1  ORF type:complete len:768 (+),score=135.56 gb/GECG01016141.1/:1-2304(+)
MMNEAIEKGFDVPRQGQPTLRGATPPNIAARAIHVRAGQEQHQGDTDPNPIPRNSPLRNVAEGFHTKGESTYQEGIRQTNGEHAFATAGPRIEARNTLDNFTEYIQPPVAPQVTEAAAQGVASTHEQRTVSGKQEEANVAESPVERAQETTDTERRQHSVAESNYAVQDSGTRPTPNEDITGYGSATVEFIDTMRTVRGADGSKGPKNQLNTEESGNQNPEQTVPGLTEPLSRDEHATVGLKGSQSVQLSLQRVQSEGIGYEDTDLRVIRPPRELSISKSTVMQTIPTLGSGTNVPRKTQQQQQANSPRSLGDEVRLLKGSVSELREMMMFVLKSTEGGQSFLKDLEQRRKAQANRPRPNSAQSADQRTSPTESVPTRQHEQVGTSIARVEFYSAATNGGVSASTTVSQCTGPQTSTHVESSTNVGGTEGAQSVPTQYMNIEDYPFLNTEAKTLKMQEDDFKRLAQCLHNAAVQELNSYYGNKPRIQLPAEFYKDIQVLRTRVENQIGNEYRIASRRKADLAKEVEAMEQRHREEVAKELRTHEKEKEKFNKSREIMRKKEALKQDKGYRHSPTADVEGEYRPQSETEAATEYGTSQTSLGPSTAQDQKQPLSKESRESKEAREKQERKEKTREEAHRREKRLLEQRVKEEDERHAEENRKREEDRRRQLKHFAERARRIEEKRSQKVSAYLADAETAIRQIVDQHVNSPGNAASAAERITSESQQGTVEHVNRLKVATGLADHAELGVAVENDTPPASVQPSNGSL